MDKHTDASALRAENHKLIEQEILEMEKANRKPDSKADPVTAPMPKVTGTELSHRREEEHLHIEREAEAAKKHQSQTVGMEE